MAGPKFSELSVLVPPPTCNKVQDGTAIHADIGIPQFLVNRFAPGLTHYIADALPNTDGPIATHMPNNSKLNIEESAIVDKRGRVVTGEIDVSVKTSTGAVEYFGTAAVNPRDSTGAFAEKDQKAVAASATAELARTAQKCSFKPF